MAGDSATASNWKILRRFVLGLLVALCLLLFLLWRIDNPRVERFRMMLIDRFVPSMSWVLTPITSVSRILDDYRSYEQIYQQNLELRRELQRLEVWREAASQLEQKNAELRALNNLRLNPSLAYVAGELMADAGSPFSQSGLLNVGLIDGVADGQAVVDGRGLIGRIAGVGERTSRLLFLTDSSSQVPVTLPVARQRAILVGDNTANPILQFATDPNELAAGMRVVTSGDGGVFPPDLLVGELVRSPDGRLRVALAADYRNAEFLRVLRNAGEEQILGPGGIIGDIPPTTAEVAPATLPETAPETTPEPETPVVEDPH
ncbi:rod shape-determining protein MreC [Abyssibius alkaniclasticus]|uniref:rod shape-determining protein MreC n=1 Tax=Abyssibius alkaniclasticus TaxID=2881234 RepID=UPI0040595F10